MTSDDLVIRVDQLTVKYGRTVAVDHVSFGVPHGSVYALLGRNGAGKSSLIRCLLGVQRAAGGSATLFGKNSWVARAKLMQRVAVVAEEPDAPPDMTPVQILQFCSRLYSRWNHQRALERLRRLEVPLKLAFGRLSKGQKRQVLLAAALASEPELLVLDDPTLGLDVVARKELFEDLIEDLAERGTTVLVTTHDLPGIEGIADRIGVLSNGRLALDEDLETLKWRFRRIRFSTAADQAELTRLDAVGVRRWGGGIEAVVANYDDLAMERFRGSAGVRDVEVSPMSLEEIFIALTETAKGAAS